MSVRLASFLKAALLSAHVPTRTLALAAAAATTVGSAAAAAARTVAATTTPIAATATAPKGTATAAARGTGLLLLSFVHAKRATTEVHAIELLRRLYGVFRILEIDEGEAARAAGHPIRGKEDFANRAGL